ncbi:MAG: hypothetical protein ABI887_11070 [Burkholderiales bacterium]
MKRLIALGLAALAIGSAQAQPQVGVSVSVHQPGVWGRINIGGLPPPALVLPQPVLISPPRVAIQREPIYLYVPPTHQQNWRRYCGRYGACGQPVYFVQDRWVRERYAEHHPGWDRGRHRGWDHRDDRGRGHGRGHDRDHGPDRRP